MVLTNVTWDKFLSIVEMYFNACDTHNCTSCVERIIYLEYTYLGKSGRA